MRAAHPKSNFEILSDLNQAEPNHLAGESQCVTRLHHRTIIRLLVYPADAFDSRLRGD